MAKKTKSIRKSFRLTEEESKRYAQLAEEKGVSESELFRFLLSQKPKEYPELRIMIRELITEVNHIGVNVNQITKNYNSGFYSQQDKACMIAYLQKIYRRLDEVVGIIGNM